MNESTETKLVAFLVIFYLIGSIFSFGHAVIHLEPHYMKSWDVVMATLLWPFYLSWQFQL